MSCYAVESDKLFLCCKDIHVMEVYEIDSLYIAPVRQKHWTFLATVHLGDGQEFEALRIGDRDLIKGRDLERLMQDLMSLGIMVNREGLCFLRTRENNISDQCQVEYYRMFDLFDWSKYSVKSRLNTRWIRNDIANGRPILDYCAEILSEKEAELKERIKQHNEQLDALNRNHSPDIKELKCKRSEELAAFEHVIGELEELKRNHSRDIQELKHNHTEEIAAFERKTEEMVHKHCEDIEELKRTHTEEISAFERVMEEMEHKHCEDIEELKRKHAVELAACECEQQKVESNEVREEAPNIKYWEDELKLYLSRPCEYSHTLISVSLNLMSYFEHASPVWKFNDPIEPCHKVTDADLPSISDIFVIILVVLPSCRGKNSPKSYLGSIAHYLGLLRDKHWHLHHFEDISDTKLQPGRWRSILFYNGTMNLREMNYLRLSVIDDPEVCPSGYEGWGVFYVPGYGFRFGFVFVTR